MAPLGVLGGYHVTLMVELSTCGVVVKNVLDILTVLVTSSGGLDTKIQEIKIQNRKRTIWYMMQWKIFVFQNFTNIKAK